MKKLDKFPHIGKVFAKVGQNFTIFSKNQKLFQLLGVGLIAIYRSLREGEGHILLKLCDRSSLLSVVSHSLSAYITTLGMFYKQRLFRKYDLNEDLI